ncbi:MAG: undecaprenyl-diphosphatase UppP [Bacteroidota bacterium]
MTNLEAILLGIIQGLTEFLPISSTAHLTIAGHLLGLINKNNPAAWTAFIGVMQLGTLLAVVIYFFNDVSAIVRSFIKDIISHGARFSRYSNSSRLGMYLIVGTIPVGIVGLLLSDLIHGMFTKSLAVISTSLVVLAVLLWVAEKRARHSRSVEELHFRDAVLIGAAQALALIPGASRSGTTLMAGLFLGLTRPAAARFSFLLSIPAILASGVYEMLKIDPAVFTLGISNLVISTIAAAVSGYLAIAWLLKYLATNTTMVFVWYRIALGVSLAAFIAFGVMSS